jgi:L-ascorbate metabolism protein UlaG (beta-lactamase superfamily)
MVIEWLGHSCFKVTLKGDGRVVLFDPYDDATGYSRLDVRADYVTISHDHHDHNNLSGVKGKYSVVKTAGVNRFDGLTIEGIETWHDHSKGKQRGANLVFLLKKGGMTVCHMGDIGCVPSDDVIKKLEGTDILMIPVGGRYTVDAKEALEICGRLSPNIIIPMHYKTSVCNVAVEPVDFFLEAAGGEYDISRLGKNIFEIDKSTFKKRTRIVVMDYL